MWKEAPNTNCLRLAHQRQGNELAHFLLHGVSGDLLCEVTLLSKFLHSYLLEVSAKKLGMKSLK